MIVLLVSTTSIVDSGTLSVLPISPAHDMTMTPMDSTENQLGILGFMAMRVYRPFLNNPIIL